MNTWLFSLVSTALLITPLLWVLPRLRLSALWRVIACRLTILVAFVGLLPGLTPPISVPATPLASAEPTSLPLLVLWLTCVWAAGVLLVVAQTVGEQRRWRRSLSPLRPVTEAELGRITELAHALGCRCPRALRSPGVRGALIMPGWRPILAVGPGDLSDEILRHEIAHLKGRDLLWLAVARLCASIFWFHPGIWRIERELVLAHELRADGVGANGNPRGFARVLLEAGACEAPMLVQAFTSGADQLRRRIVALRKPPRTGVLSALAFAGLLGLALAARIEPPRPLSERGVVTGGAEQEVIPVTSASAVKVP